jgi:hypothetical protein
MANLVRLNNFGFYGVIIERTNDTPLPIPIGSTEIIVDIDDQKVRDSLHKFRGKLVVMSFNLSLRLKYALASASRVHMDADLDFLVSNNLLEALPEDATQMQLVTHLNAIKSAMNDHALSTVVLDEGNQPVTDGSHQDIDVNQVDELELLADLDTESLPNDSDTYDRILALFASNTTHYQSTNPESDLKVHFHDDVDLIDLIPPLHGPNLEYNVGATNQLRTRLLLHFAKASV